MLILLALTPLWSFAKEKSEKKDEAGITILKEETDPVQVARKVYDKGDYKKALSLIREVFEKSKPTQYFLEGKLLLAQSYLKIGKPKEAIAPLNAYIQAKGNSPDGLKAQNFLSRAYLGAGMFEEAILAAISVIDQNTKNGIPAETFLEAILLKGRVFLKVNRELDAQKAFVSYGNELRKRNNEVPVTSSIRAEGHTLTIEVKRRYCDKLFPKGKFEEEALGAALFQYRNCIVEALSEYRDVLKTGQTNWISASQKMMIDLFKRLYQISIDPPSPADKRTREEVRQYKKEVKLFLYKEYREYRSHVLEIAKKWKTQLPKDTTKFVDQFFKTALPPL